jgi:hypothetical protein
VEEGGYLWRVASPVEQRDPDGLARRPRRLGPLQGHHVLRHAPHGISATGRWVGLSYGGNNVTGWSSMARTEADARELVDELKEQDAPNSR